MNHLGRGGVIMGERGWDKKFSVVVCFKVIFVATPYVKSLMASCK